MADKKYSLTRPSRPYPQTPLDPSLQQPFQQYGLSLPQLIDPAQLIGNSALGNPLTGQGFDSGAIQGGLPQLAPQSAYQPPAASPAAGAPIQSAGQQRPPITWREILSSPQMMNFFGLLASGLAGGGFAGQGYMQAQAAQRQAQLQEENIAERRSRLQRENIMARATLVNDLVNQSVKMGVDPSYLGKSYGFGDDVISKAQTIYKTTQAKKIPVITSGENAGKIATDEEMTGATPPKVSYLAPDEALTQQRQYESAQGIAFDRATKAIERLTDLGAAIPERWLKQLGVTGAQIAPGNRSIMVPLTEIPESVRETFAQKADANGIVTINPRDKMYWDLFNEAKKAEIMRPPKSEFDAWRQAFMAEHKGRQPTAAEITKHGQQKQVFAFDLKQQAFGITPESIDNNATAVLEGRDTLSNIGRGFGGAMLQGQVRARVLQLNPKFDFNRAEADFAWSKSSQFQRQNRALESVDKELKYVTDLSNKVSRLGSPWLNKPVLGALRALGLNQDELIQFQTATKDIAYQIPIAMSGSAQAVGSDRRTDMALSMADPNLNTSQFLASVKAISDLSKIRGGFLRKGTTYGQGEGATSEPDYITINGKVVPNPNKK